VCFSDDCTRLAIVRRDYSGDLAASLMSSKISHVIDIFDTSDVSFFLEEGEIDFNDAKHICSISDPELKG